MESSSLMDAVKFAISSEDGSSGLTVGTEGERGDAIMRLSLLWRLFPHATSGLQFKLAKAAQFRLVT